MGPEDAGEGERKSVGLWDRGSVVIFISGVVVRFGGSSSVESMSDGKG